MDQIDAKQVQVLNSPDIRDWPATTEITVLELKPSGVHIEFTRQIGPDRWPDIPFGDPKDGGSLQYTLWIVLNIGGQWFAAGVLEFWFGLFESGGPVTDYAANWYYDPNRWAPMSGHQPAPGELVGFLVTSGDARHGNDAIGLHERSNIVVVDFPTAAGERFTFASAPAPAPAPPPAPVPTPAPAPAPAPDFTTAAALEDLRNRVTHLESAVANQIEQEAPFVRVVGLLADNFRIISGLLSGVK